MRKTPGPARLLLAGVALASGLTAAPADAACEYCFAYIFSTNYFCKPVVDGEGGVTNCQDGSDIFGTWCTESGNYCETTTVGGGGGGTGGGGGGGGSCVTSGYCPAYCFSCSPPLY